MGIVAREYHYWQPLLTTRAADLQTVTHCMFGLANYIHMAVNFHSTIECMCTHATNSRLKFDGLRGRSIKCSQEEFMSCTEL